MSVDLLVRVSSGARSSWIRGFDCACAFKVTGKKPNVITYVCGAIHAYLMKERAHMISLIPGSFFLGQDALRLIALKTSSRPHDERLLRPKDASCPLMCICSVLIGLLLREVCARAHFVSWAMQV